MHRFVTTSGVTKLAHIGSQRNRLINLVELDIPLLTTELLVVDVKHCSLQAQNMAVLLALRCH